MTTAGISKHSWICIACFSAKGLQSILKTASIMGRRKGKVGSGSKVTRMRVYFPLKEVESLQVCCGVLCFD